MVTLVLLTALTLQVTTPGEMACLGFIRQAAVPMNIYISGTEEDEVNNYSHTGQLVYLNGPGVASLKVGDLYSVVRPEGTIRDPATGATVGIYHKELGTVRIEATRPDSATASVASTCNVILKGDLLVPVVSKPAVTFSGKLSDGLTPYPDKGLVSDIVLGKNGIKEMAAGDICYIDLGTHDGVKLGDRFTIYRPQPPFEPRHLELDGSMAGYSYESYRSYEYRRALVNALHRRIVPPRVLGDLVVVDVQETTAVAKIINSLAEIHAGDVVVRR
jgi:hypothetical protein